MKSAADPWVEWKPRSAVMRKGMENMIVFLAVILAIGLVCWPSFGYLPGYLLKKRSVMITPADNGEIRIMSCNVRYLELRDYGKKSWFFRADKLVADIGKQKPGVIGFQEVTKWQYQYLVDTLRGYDSVITYRDEMKWSEGCPVFYNTALYTLVDKGSFWLSETPEVMSKDWGACCYRVCSYVILTDRTTGKNFVVFNTHLDHASDEARINGIRVVLEKIAQFGGLPAVIMGDFNAEEGSVTYERVTENFLDARYEAQETTGVGTFQAWGQIEGGWRIDDFMISKTGFRVLRYDVVDVVHEGVYVSDHNPIVMDVILSRE